ncbi:hypothetical protein [Rhodococcus qingshengii]|uniref:hypothetical protein n=1 Tax=Rhodococcus qingshengii TaxID=334542 RepID=UPI001F147E3F|nr:hypothetical protein [Rhodococcus qingshengii]ULD38985.1 hypothetical protein JKI97_00245 [Rhodococcus qingshengii]
MGELEGQLSLFGDSDEAVFDGLGDAASAELASDAPESQSDEPVESSDDHVAGQMSMSGDRGSETATEGPEEPAEAAEGADSGTETAEPSDGDVEVAAAAPEKVQPKLRASTAADEHAIILTDTGSYLPSGAYLAGPVDDVTKLTRLIDWMMARKGLVPKGSAPQVWMVGQGILDNLGWWIDLSDVEVESAAQERDLLLEQLTQRVHDSMSGLVVDGWEVRGDPGHRIHLTRHLTNSRRMVDLVLEPYAFSISTQAKDLGILGTGDDLPDEDMDAAAEIGRRIAWSVEHLGVLPGSTSTRTAADIVDQIMRARQPAKSRGHGKPSTRKPTGAVIDTAGPVPMLDGQLHGEIEPRTRWARLLDADDLVGVDRLVAIDQRASYLASAGSDSFGWGTPDHVPVGADRRAREGKMPYGLWRVTLPAAESIWLPEKLPLPHPHMQFRNPVTTWVTSVSLEALTAPVAGGGAGLDIDDLDLDEAWVWPNQGRALEAWATRLRKARAAAVETGDRAMKAHVGDMYKRYIGRMLNPEQWQAANKLHHHQPVWRATIMASSRQRSRRAAMALADKTGRWPIHAFADALTYVAGPDDELSDPSPNLGKLVFEKGAALTEQQIAQLAAAQDVNALRAMVAEVLDRDEEES